MLSAVSPKVTPQPVSFQGNGKNMLERLAKTEIAQKVRNVSPFYVVGAALVVLLGAWLGQFAARKGEPASFNPIKTVSNNPIGEQIPQADASKAINVFA